MNIIEKARKAKGISVKKIAVALRMNDDVYLKHEIKCDFTVSQYHRLCKLLAIDYDAPLFD